MRRTLALVLVLLLVESASVSASPCYPLYSVSTALTGVGSPLAADATVGAFVLSGYNHDIDQRLAIAISGAESQFATDNSPCLARKNAWGYGGGFPSCFTFSSYTSGVEVVTEALRRLYLNTGKTTIPLIGATWAPGQPDWVANTQTFYRRLNGNLADLTYYASCCGDCDSDRTVYVNELVTGVRQIIGTSPYAACPNMDGDLDNAVRVNDVLRAVGTAFGIPLYGTLCVAP